MYGYTALETFILWIASTATNIEHYSRFTGFGSANLPFTYQSFCVCLQLSEAPYYMATHQNLYDPVTLFSFGCATNVRAQYSRILSVPRSLQAHTITSGIYPQANTTVRLKRSVMVSRDTSNSRPTWLNEVLPLSVRLFDHLHVPKFEPTMQQPPLMSTSPP